MAGVAPCEFGSSSGAPARTRTLATETCLCAMAWLSAVSRESSWSASPDQRIHGAKTAHRGGHHQRRLIAGADVHRRPPGDEFINHDGAVVISRGDHCGMDGIVRFCINVRGVYITPRQLAQLQFALWLHRGPSRTP